MPTICFRLLFSERPWRDSPQNHSLWRLFPETFHAGGVEDLFACDQQMFMDDQPPITLRIIKENYLFNINAVPTLIEQN